MKKKKWLLVFIALSLAAALGYGIYKAYVYRDYTETIYEIELVDSEVYMLPDSIQTNSTDITVFLQSKVPGLQAYLYYAGESKPILQMNLDGKKSCRFRNLSSVHLYTLGVQIPHEVTPQTLSVGVRYLPINN